MMRCSTQIECMRRRRRRKIWAFLFILFAFTQSRFNRALQSIKNNLIIYFFEVLILPEYMRCVNMIFRPIHACLRWKEPLKLDNMKFQFINILWCAMTIRLQKKNTHTAQLFKFGKKKLINSKKYSILFVFWAFFSETKIQMHSSSQVISVECDVRKLRTEW